jgi:hypothetical protein
MNLTLRKGEDFLFSAYLNGLRAINNPVNKEEQTDKNF